MQFGFMPDRGIIDAVQEEHHARGKRLYMCFVDLYKAFYRVQRKVLEWAMRKKGVPDVLVRSMMSLYEGAKTRVRVESELSEEFEVKVGCTKDLFCLLFLVVDVVAEFAREFALSELLYADD